MTKKAHIIIIVSAIFAVIAVYLAVFFMVENIGVQKPTAAKKGLKAVSSSLARGKEAEAVSKAKRRPVLVVSRPQDVGIKVIPEEEKPGKLEDWHKVISDVMPEAKKQLTPEQAAEIRKSLILDDPAKAAERREQMQQADSVVKELEEKLAKNPSDRETKARLEKINMLKGIGKAMEESFK